MFISKIIDKIPGFESLALIDLQPTWGGLQTCYKENKIVLIDNDISATSVVLWPGASREMYLCYSALFSSMQAQRGNGGRGRESVHVRSSAGTSPSGPLLCRGLLRKVSEKGPLEDQGCHSKSPYQLEVLRRRGVHWSKVLTSFSRVKNVYSCAHPDKVFRPLFSPPFIIFS